MLYVLLLIGAIVVLCNINKLSLYIKSGAKRAVKQGQWLKNYLSILTSFSSAKFGDNSKFEMKLAPIDTGITEHGYTLPYIAYKLVITNAPKYKSPYDTGTQNLSHYDELRSTFSECLLAYGEGFLENIDVQNMLKASLRGFFNTHVTFDTFKKAFLPAVLREPDEEIDDVMFIARFFKKITRTDDNTIVISDLRVWLPESFFTINSGETGNVAPMKLIKRFIKEVNK